MTRLTWLLLFGTTAALAESGQVADLLKKGDSLERSFDSRGALEMFECAEKIEPKNPAILLRISKQYSDLLAEAKAGEAERMGRAALKYAQRAVDLDPANAKAHLCLAISYGKLTDFCDNKTKLRYAKLVREEATKSIALDPTDDYAYHVLGRWHYGMANINAVLRAMAKLMYGGLPAASNEEAIRNLKKAVELAPQRVIHRSELARVYTTMSKTALAASEWKAVLELPAHDKEDAKDKAEATAALRAR